MVVFSPIVRRRKQRGTGRALEIRDFFGTLIHEQRNEGNLRMVLRDGCCNLLEQKRFPGARWGHDQGPLSFSDGSGQIHDPGREIGRICNQVQLLVRIDNVAFVKIPGVIPFFCRDTHDSVNLADLPVPFSSRAEFSLQEYAVAKVVSFDDGWRNEGIGISFWEVVTEFADKTEPLVADHFHDAGEWLGFATSTPATASSSTAISVVAPIGTVSASGAAATFGAITTAAAGPVSASTFGAVA